MARSICGRFTAWARVGHQIHVNTFQAILSAELLNGVCHQFGIEVGAVIAEPFKPR